jgi:hypothetical protein
MLNYTRDLGLYDAVAWPMRLPSTTPVGLGSVTQYCYSKVCHLYGYQLAILLALINVNDRPKCYNKAMLRPEGRIGRFFLDAPWLYFLTNNLPKEYGRED